MTHILIVGGGGREHALAWKLAQSDRVTRISVAPGNGGIREVPRASCVDIDATDIVSLLDFAEIQAVDLTVIGPEEALAGGLVDQFVAAGLRVFGPTQGAARIETSKSYAKDLMTRCGVPTPSYEQFTELEPALEYVMHQGVDQVVIKANGLARGKGVFLPKGGSDAEGLLRALLEWDSLGRAGRTVIVEQRLAGPEISVMAFTDGVTMVTMPAVRDHKRLHDHDVGPNTGGMGTYAPAPVLTPAPRARIEAEIIEPVLAGLRHDGRPFSGVLTAGVILTQDGPCALEFNVRFGDPAAQVVLPLLDADLLDILDACVEGTLDQVDVRWHHAAAVAVVLVTEGYPTRRDPGIPITFDPAMPDNVLSFHAGTRYTGDNMLVTTGGRVMALTGVAEDLHTAIALAYDAVRHVHFDGMHYRSDIGVQALRYGR